MQCEKDLIHNGYEILGINAINSVGTRMKKRKKIFTKEKYLRFKWV